MLDRDGHVVLTDFGLSKEMKPQEVHTYIHTYMSCDVRVGKEGGAVGPGYGASSLCANASGSWYKSVTFCVPHIFMLCR